MTQEEIVAQHLNIVDLTAGWLWVRWREHLRRLGIDREELGGMAVLAFVEAVARWDTAKSPEGEDGLGAYLVQHTRWRLTKAVNRLTQAGRAPEEGSLVSLQAPVNENGGSLADLLGEDNAELELLERTELLASVMDRLDAMDRECVRLVVGEEMMVSAAAEQLQMARHCVRTRVDRGMALARRAAARAIRRFTACQK